jgi:hypothetical protein
VTMDEVEIDRSIVASRQPPARNKASKKPPPERLRWFDQWRGARGPALRSLVATIREALDEHEKAAGERKRTRPADVQRRYEIAVETVVANLAHSALVNPSDSRLATSPATRRAASTATRMTPSGSLSGRPWAALRRSGWWSGGGRFNAAWRRLWPLQSAL